MDDVIELGEDGGFELPQEPAIPTAEPVRIVRPPTPPLRKAKEPPPPSPPPPPPLSEQQPQQLGADDTPDEEEDRADKVTYKIYDIEKNNADTSSSSGSAVEMMEIVIKIPTAMQQQQHQVGQNVTVGVSIPKDGTSIKLSIGTLQYRIRLERAVASDSFKRAYCCSKDGKSSALVTLRGAWKATGRNAAAQ